MGFIDIYCMPLLIIQSLCFFPQKFPSFGNFFNFIMFRFSLKKKKVLMINYFCNKKLKANIIEIFVCNFKLFG